MKAPRVCIITGYGINADEELALAFGMVGGEPVRVHVQDLIEQRGAQLGEYRIIAFPGGFSFGDHLGSGKVFATLFRRNLGPALTRFLSQGGLAIGICNGFQVLAKMGVLPDRGHRGEQEVSLIQNRSGKFEDRWVRVSFDPASRCVWTRGLPDMDLPVRHGEGRFITDSPSTLTSLESEGLIAVRYVSTDGSPIGYPQDPNGSDGHVAGICDPTGRVFGLMPHPEAFMHPENHPDWSTHGIAEGMGLRVFANGVRAAAARA